MPLRMEKSMAYSSLPSNYYAAAGPLKEHRVKSDGHGREGQRSLLWFLLLFLNHSIQQTLHEAAQMLPQVMTFIFPCLAVYGRWITGLSVSEYEAVCAYMNPVCVHVCGCVWTPSRGKGLWLFDWSECVMMRNLPFQLSHGRSLKHEAHNKNLYEILICFQCP